MARSADNFRPYPYLKGYPDTEIIVSKEAVHKVSK